MGRVIQVFSQIGVELLHSDITQLDEKKYKSKEVQLLRKVTQVHVLKSMNITADKTVLLTQASNSSVMIYSIYIYIYIKQLNKHLGFI